MQVGWGEAFIGIPWSSLYSSSTLEVLSSEAIYIYIYIFKNPLFHSKQLQYLLFFIHLFSICSEIDLSSNTFHTGLLLCCPIFVHLIPTYLFMENLAEHSPHPPLLDHIHWENIPFPRNSPWFFHNHLAYNMTSLWFPIFVHIHNNLNDTDSYFLRHIFMFSLTLNLHLHFAACMYPFHFTRSYHLRSESPGFE